jgi:hypothetical protein
MLEAQSSLGASFGPTCQIHQNYHELAALELVELLEHLWNGTRYSDSTLQHTDKLTLASTDDIVLDAYSMPWEDGFSLRVSLGTLLALDDWCFRLCCNADFLSFDPMQQGKRVWPGCTCLWPQVSGAVQQIKRYYDSAMQFRPDLNPLDAPPLVLRNRLEVNLGDPALSSTLLAAMLEHHMVRQIEGSFHSLSRYYSGVPFENEGRCRLAYLMVEIALAWIIMHEEGHYCEGHLLYLRELGRDGRNDFRLNETRDRYDSIDEEHMRKVMEWQADRAATWGVVDVFYRPELFKILPPYAQQEPSHWLTRVLLASIGAAILLLQKAQAINGASSAYPSPRTRLVAMLDAAFARIAKVKAKGLTKAASGDSQPTFDDPIDIIPSTLEELSTAASIINNEGAYAGRNAAGTPQVDSTGPLGLLDSDLEAYDLASLILHSRLPWWLKGVVDFKIGPTGQQRIVPRQTRKRLHKEWLAELEMIVALHNARFYRLFRKYKAAAGGLAW